MRKFFRALWLVASASFKTDKRAATIVSILTIISAGSDAALALGLKMLVNAISHQGWDLLFAAALIVGSLIISQCVSLGFPISVKLQEQTSFFLEMQLVKLTTHITSLEPYERPDYLD